MQRNGASRWSLLRLGAAVGATSVLGGCRLFGSRKADVVADPQNHAISLTEEESSNLLASEGGILIKPQRVRDKILAVHAKDGSLHAVSRSAHMGCDVLYDEELGHIRCPCHGSQYGLDGRNIQGPAKRPLKQYEIHNDGARIIILL